MPCQAAEQFGVLRHAVHVRLEETKAFFERGEFIDARVVDENIEPAKRFDRRVHDALRIRGLHNAANALAALALARAIDLPLAALLREAMRAGRSSR